MAPRIAILGLGLMGGSLWRRLAAEGYPVTGYDIDPATRMAARADATTMSNPSAGRIVDTIPAAVADAEVAVLGVWVPDVEGLMHQIHETGFGGILTDVTSVKQPVQDIIDRKYPGTRWIGGHPMVGFSRQGYTSSHGDMYEDCPWVLCIDEDAKPASTMRDWLFLARIFTSIGARVVPITARNHDEAVARISHTPHIVANALTLNAAASPLGHLALTLGAGSFRDSTRVATSSPDRTASFCSWNSDALADELDQLIARLNQARMILRSGSNNTQALRDWLWPGHVVRSAWPPLPDNEVSFAASGQSLLELGHAGGWVRKVNGTQVVAVRPTSIPLR